MPKTHFLRPVTFNAPAKGDFDFTPLVVFLEAPTIEALQHAYIDAITTEGEGDDQWSELVSVSYQVTAHSGNQLSYSCALHFNLATRV